VLLARLAPGDDRRQEDPGGEERRRRPEQRELHVPGAGQVERQHLRQVDAEEAGQVGAVVLDRAAEQRLGEKQHRDDEEEVRRDLLRRGDLDLARLPERERRLLGGVPADLAAPPPVQREQPAQAAEQGDQREPRPDHDVGRRAVVDPRLRGPVVGVGVVVPRPLRGGRPRGPREERRELVDLLGIGDRLGDQAVLGAVLAEVVGVVLLDRVERRDLLVGEDQLAAVLVVPVLAQHVAGGLARVLGAGVGQRLLDVLGREPQVLRGVVGAEVAAVADDRAVLLQAATQEDLLAGRHVVAGVDGLAVLADDAIGQRHGVGVGAGRQHAHHQESEHHDQGDALDPPLGEVELGPLDPTNRSCVQCHEVAPEIDDSGPT